MDYLHYAMQEGESYIFFSLHNLIPKQQTHLKKKKKTFPLLPTIEVLLFYQKKRLTMKVSPLIYLMAPSVVY